MRPIRSLLPLLFLAAIHGTPAAAAPGQAAAPIELEADRVEIDDGRGVSVYEGGVVITQGARIARADRVVVYDDERGPARMELHGTPAVLEDRTADGTAVRGEARRIDYDLRTEVMVLTGEARLHQGSDRFAGARIRYDLRAGRVEAEGGEGRVRILLEPRDAEAAPQ